MCWIRNTSSGDKLVIKVEVQASMDFSFTYRHIKRREQEANLTVQSECTNKQKSDSCSYQMEGIHSVHVGKHCDLGLFTFCLDGKTAEFVYAKTLKKGQC